ncbi:MAG: peptidylprolyl isomerase [bacterium]
MKKTVLALALLFLGAGCGNQNTTGTVTPYGTSQDLLDTRAPVAAYDQNNPITAKTDNNSAAETKKNMEWKFPGKLPDADLLKKTVVIETAKGNIEFEVFGAEAPLAASNFLYLTKGGFYNGLTFHRREEGFVIQGGDPSGNGTGGPGYRFNDEPVKLSYDRGIVAMANAGPNTNGSQFFIMLGNTPLPPSYTIFGKVTKGMEVVDKIVVGDKMTSVTVK